MAIRDNLRILSKLTRRRLINALKIYLSFLVSRLLHRPVLWGLPISASIEPTTSCNLRCPECPSGLRSFTRPTGMLSETLFRDAITDLSTHLWYLTFYFQGEPYLNPNFLDMVRFAVQQGIYTSTSTNAHYLSDAVAKATVLSGLDRLIVSIDGTTQATYESYRIGGDLEKVIAGTKNILNWKKQLKSTTPHVIFQFLVVRSNEHQLKDLKALAKSLGVNEVRFKTAQVYDYKNSKLIPENPKYARYRKSKDGGYLIGNAMDNHCWRLWSGTVITWDGQVVPCCFDKDASFEMGKISGQLPFKTIWNNQPYKEFRANLVVSRKENSICANCSEGSKVWTQT